MNTIIVLIIFVVVGLLAYLAFKSIEAVRIRSQMGSLRVEIDDDLKASGDISGRIYIDAKKPIKSESMVVRLSGTTDSLQIVDDDDGDDSGEARYEKVKEEFYSQTFKLNDSANHTPENIEAIPFSIPFPSETEFQSSAYTTGGKSYRELTNVSGRSDWNIYTTLDVPGLDFHDSSAFTVTGEPVESKS